MKTIFTLFITCLLFLSLSRLVALQTEVTLFSGEKLYGDITQETNDAYLMTLDTTSKKIEIQKKDIRGISSINYTPLSQYIVLGCAFGNPGILMPVIGFHYNSIGIHLSGGADDSASRFQFEVVWNFVNKITFTHGIALAFGDSYKITRYQEFSFIQTEKSKTITDTWRYAGIAYVFNAKVFYFELGITYGTGTYRNPQPMYQIGILHRFNRKRIASPYTPITRVESFPQ